MCYSVFKLNAAVSLFVIVCFSNGPQQLTLSKLKKKEETIFNVVKIFGNEILSSLAKYKNR